MRAEGAGQTAPLEALKKMQGGNQQRQNNNHDEKVIKDRGKLFTL